MIFTGFAPLLILILESWMKNGDLMQIDLTNNYVSLESSFVADTTHFILS